MYTMHPGQILMISRETYHAVYTGDGYVKWLCFNFAFKQYFGAPPRSADKRENTQLNKKAPALQALFYLPNFMAAIFIIFRMGRL